MKTGVKNRQTYFMVIGTKPKEDYGLKVAAIKWACKRGGKQQSETSGEKTRQFATLNIYIVHK